MQPARVKTTSLADTICRRGAPPRRRAQRARVLSADAEPLVLASGAGAESRMVIGVVVMWGVGISMFVTLLLIPVLYSLLARRTGSPHARQRQLETEQGAITTSPE